ncbi:MAG: hypothetical protein ABJF10_30010 [Chthoniobacter sp.]|uniref:hypothetical protein n=1 Tax=Chthoniobacter sp. TaxID=2510640 RepID=UPI0032AC9E86
MSVTITDTQIEQEGYSYRSDFHYLSAPHWPAGISEIAIFHRTERPAPARHAPLVNCIGARYQRPGEEFSPWRFAELDAMDYAGFRHVAETCPVILIPGDGRLVCDGGDNELFLRAGLCTLRLQWSSFPPQGWHAIQCVIKELERLRDKLLPEALPSR